jgi:hypothetical protein
MCLGLCGIMSRSVCLGNLTGKEIKLELRSENQFWAGQNGTIKIAFSTLSLMIFNITSSWRSATNKQYQFAWRKFVFWCRQRKINPFQSSEKDVIEYINFLKNQNLSYAWAI